MVFNKEKFEECCKLLEDHYEEKEIPFTSSELYKLITNVKKAVEVFSSFVNKKEGYAYIVPINEQRTSIENNLKRIKELSGYNFKLGDFVTEEKDESKTN